ncbi:hypothetical protein [Frankia sp. Cas3]|uniref:hypothetical protein n=1 Tax=Frankia sp. Cas3 TaxID=3073926 RepID=UPI002AD41837|nr:hypothetical protein [Frankia sp. Cas3]
MADDEAEHYVVTIRPMASPAELIRMWASLPDDVRFTEAFGDVEFISIFQRPAEAGPVTEMSDEANDLSSGFRRIPPVRGPLDDPEAGPLL